MPREDEGAPTTKQKASQHPEVFPYMEKPPDVGTLWDLSTRERERKAAAETTGPGTADSPE